MRWAGRALDSSLGPGPPAPAVLLVELLHLVPRSRAQACRPLRDLRPGAAPDVSQQRLPGLRQACSDPCASARCNGHSSVLPGLVLVRRQPEVGHQEGRSLQRRAHPGIGALPGSPRGTKGGPLDVAGPVRPAKVLAALCLRDGLQLAELLLGRPEPGAGLVVQGEALVELGEGRHGWQGAVLVCRLQAHEVKGLRLLVVQDLLVGKARVEGQAHRLMGLNEPGVLHLARHHSPAERRRHDKEVDAAALVLANRAGGPVGCHDDGSQPPRPAADLVRAAVEVRPQQPLALQAADCLLQLVEQVGVDPADAEPVLEVGTKDMQSASYQRVDRDAADPALDDVSVATATSRPLARGDVLAHCNGRSGPGTALGSRQRRSGRHSPAGPVRPVLGCLELGPRRQLVLLQ